MGIDRGDDRLQFERGGANARSAWVFDHLPDRDGPKRGPLGVHAANAARQTGCASVGGCGKLGLLARTTRFSDHYQPEVDVRIPVADR
jgi:hypothetical protein